MKYNIKKYLQIDFILALFFRGSGVLLSFVLNIVLARKYGPELTGEYFIFYNFMTLVASIAFMGLSYVIVHRLTPLYGVNKSEESDTGNTLLSLTVYILLANLLLVSLTIAIASPWLSKYLGGSAEYVMAIIISAIGILPYTAIMTLAELLKALKKPNQSILAINILVNAVFICFLALNSNIAINEMLVLFGISNVIAFILIIIINLSQIKKVGLRIFSLSKTIKKTEEYKDLCRDYLNENWQLTAVGVSNVVLNVFDTLVIGNMLSSTDVAIYSIANKVVSFGSIILTTVNVVIGYKIAELSFTNNKQGLRNILVKYTRVMMPISLVYYVAAIVFSMFIPTIFGIEYDGSVNLAMVLAIGQVITIATGPCSYFLIMTGYTKKYRQIVVTTAALTIVLNIILVKLFGVYGSAISSVFVLFYKNVYTFIFAKGTVGLKISDFYVRCMRNEC
ncbi:MAG: oligosaccharide flippase family protein [Candidatus Methanofastidiosum sp.]|nr:oligosaccharide flippase family protein [Methanofastidiosum sp.]